MRKIERLLLLYLPVSVFLASVSQQKQCVRDYKQTIIPVFITVSITVCLCRTYCNGVVWFDGCLGHWFLSIAPIIPVCIPFHCRNVCLHIRHSAASTVIEVMTNVNVPFGTVNWRCRRARGNRGEERKSSNLHCSLFTVRGGDDRETRFMYSE